MDQLFELKKSFFRHSFWWHVKEKTMKKWKVWFQNLSFSFLEYFFLDSFCGFFISSTLPLAFFANTHNRYSFEKKAKNQLFFFISISNTFFCWFRVWFFFLHATRMSKRTIQSFFFLFWEKFHLTCRNNTFSKVKSKAHNHWIEPID